MQITVDVSEIEGFAEAMAAAPGVLQAEMTEASDDLLTRGQGYARDNAPRKSDALADSIVIIDGPNASGGAYGSDLIYAWMREEGGTIVPKKGQFLVFEIGGRLVFARSVTQEGSHYMQDSADQLEPEVEPRYGEAIDRTLEAI